MDDKRLDKIEKMLQVTLEAICSLAQEVTGKSMVIGYFEDSDHFCTFGGTALSDRIKWVKIKTSHTEQGIK